MIIGWLSSMLRRRRAQAPPAPPVSPAPRPAFEIELKPARAARSARPDQWLALAIERAVARGDLGRAEAIARSADRLVRCNPSVAAAITRFHLSRGEADMALAAVEDSIVRTDDLRGLRIIALVLTRRRRRARAELRAWRRGSPVSAAAVALTLLAESNHRTVNRQLARLGRRVARSDDAMSLAAITTRCLERGDAAGAAVGAARLSIVLRRHDRAAVAPAASQSPPSAVDLARSILSHEDVVPALVLAQQLQPDPPSARILRAALEQSLPQFDRPAIAYDALTRLSLVLGDVEAAGRWIERGCRACPLSAPLAALQREVEAATLAGSPHDRGDVTPRAASDHEPRNRKAA